VPWPLYEGHSLEPAYISYFSGTLNPTHFTSMVTYGLTACTPGSAPDPTLGIEYEKAFAFIFASVMCLSAD